MTTKAQAKKIAKLYLVKNLMFVLQQNDAMNRIKGNPMYGRKCLYMKFLIKMNVQNS